MAKTISILGSLFALGAWLAASTTSVHAQNTATTVTYVYTNAQGSPLAKADAQGNIIARYTYRPYGTKQSGPTNKGPGYTGHVNDPASGLVYMQQRYYDPSIGRFISPDPVGPAAGNVFNFNRYTYANDNPLRYTDPDGRQEVFIAADPVIFRPIPVSETIKPLQVPDPVQYYPSLHYSSRKR